jgi:hypothetical protein
MSLDAIIDADECASWLRISRRELLAKTRGKHASIPCFKIGQRTPRFHPRTVVAALASRAGVKPEVIAASLNLNAA